MSIDILEKLWDQYIADNPHAKEIYDLFVENGEKPENDHIALRTLDDDRINIHQLAKAFISRGYKVCNNYDFEVKKLKAIHLEHNDENEPKVFISQLLTKEFSKELQETLKKCVDAIPQDLINNPDKLLLSGISWLIKYEEYKKLLDESEYAAWFYAFGFRANHFTVFINQLRNFNEVSEVNHFLKENGFKLNSSGGEVKGSQEDLLEQSSTMSGLAEVAFDDGTKQIPSCYYEFAKRYKDSNGKLYQGFVAKSADKIFESTNTK
ncbi:MULTISPECIES: DUF1338 domain-containing protein [unclassified Francisella]|uniref:DUF1338 domain-containing protein n=1 Tax=unclassified Francisella TaxID=2610885 RepID=UPI002E343914|nr:MULTISPECIES: DUF1338 domain-containing protein [unclassified Francisella]MED7819799.1 DUF1338 domain-containing protein [Francisella sp. 19S2-4]MED7830619.1 DUF1338 domain-containing protein [Francisella sp. 19S2-10]